jgi:hypothetical protein
VPAPARGRIEPGEQAVGFGAVLNLAAEMVVTVN